MRELGALGLGSNRRDYGAVDAARQAQHDLAESVLGTIVSQAAKHRLPWRFLDGRERHDIASGTVPAVLTAFPVRYDEIALEAPRLKHQLVARFHSERGAVAHQFVLPADLVEIQQRHAVF